MTWYNSYMSLDLITILASLIALILALTLHEFAHAWVGHYLGDTTAKDQGRLTINPLAHIDPVFTLALPLISFLTTGIAIGAAKPVPFNPWAVRGGRWGASLVALAGPLTNLLLAIFFALYLRIFPANVVSYQFLGAIVVVNVGLFVFNMIPFPPLDGSRLLYAVASPRLRELMDRIESAGMGVILIFFVLLYYLGLGHYLSLVVRAIVQLLVPTGTLP
jgi:Zn-dependent protease